MKKTKGRNVFIIGSKGIPSSYGGFETFVEKLTEYNSMDVTNIMYHVSCLSSNNEIFYHNSARCFNVKVPNIGPAKAVYYDLLALKYSLKYIEENNLCDSVIYILACRIGPFMSHYLKKAKRSNTKIFVNPDGHEWKRAKWNFFIRKYWKFSEKLMVKYSNLLVCDSKNIQKYIEEEYSQFKPRTTYISYGADLEMSTLNSKDERFLSWLENHSITSNDYYLIVGRFVPENNYESMIKGFIESNSKKDLVIITNIEKNKFYNQLKSKTNFDLDARIKFVGTVYDQELLKKIRENAFAYIHGHEVGGTNPSLLEAMACTKINLLINVGFNQEVARDSALYWNKKDLSLTELINKIETPNEFEILTNNLNPRSEIISRFNWVDISNEYSTLFGDRI